MKALPCILFFSSLGFGFGLTVVAMDPDPPTAHAAGFSLDYSTPVDPELQEAFEAIESGIRKDHEMTGDDAAAGHLPLISGSFEASGLSRRS